MNDTLRLKIGMLPDSPGCYMMKEQGKIIYVGKAVNLKNRVRSYFRNTEHTPKVEAMISHIDDFEILLCRTNLEALILECNLIKLHKPYYNILLKDDKHYPFIRVNVNEPFPRVETARRQEKDGARYFGPYTGTGAVNAVMETLQKLFPLRTCKLALPLKTPRRPCVKYEIGHCPGPCAEKCTPEEYGEIVSRMTAFLSGRYQDVLDSVKKEMLEASAALQFEKAAILRDRMRDIQGLMERQQALQTAGGEQDVFAITHDTLDAMAQVLYVRGGRMVGGDHFPLPGEGGEKPEEVFLDFLLQFYDERVPAREVICTGIPEELAEDVESWLREKRGGACTLINPKRGDKRALVLMAEKNACDALLKRNAKSQVREERTLGACAALAESIGMEKPPVRIEGFDISNTQGGQSVASMIVFVNGEPCPKEYRRFKIKTVEGANDFASMGEVISRRFARAASADESMRWLVPDLILIDGGPEQVRFARGAMLEYGYDVPMFGLAERLEEIWLPERDKPVILDHHTPALQLVQRIRDEAHRFAITYHRALRSGKSIHSTLEDIEGIGPARRRALLQYFKTIRAIREADMDALMKVPGMNRKAAESVYRWSRPDDGTGHENEQE